MPVLGRAGSIFVLTILMLSPALAQSTLTSDDWHVADEIAGIFQKVIAALAIFGAAAWGFFRFIRFRTLKPRVEFSFDWSGSFPCHSGRVGILTLKLSNKGNTKIDLRKDGNDLCMLKYALVEANQGTAPVAVISRSPGELKHLGRVFVAHKSIEPGETIDDVRAIQISDLNALAVQFEIRIYGAYKWTASAAFPLAELTPAASATSEDEEDEYKEFESVRQLLESCTSEAASILLAGRAGVNEKVLSDTIQRALKATSNLKSDATREVIKEAKNVLGELNRILRVCLD
jgi:hypothetical protein